MNPPTPFGPRHKSCTAALASFAPESPQDFPALARPNQATQQGYKYQHQGINRVKPIDKYKQPAA